MEYGKGVLGILSLKVADSLTDSKLWVCSPKVTLFLLKITIYLWLFSKKLWLLDLNPKFDCLSIWTYNLSFSKSSLFQTWKTQTSCVSGGFICNSSSWLSVASSSSQCCWTIMAFQMIECYQFRCLFDKPQKR